MAFYRRVSGSQSGVLYADLCWKMIGGSTDESLRAADIDKVLSWKAHLVLCTALQFRSRKVLCCIIVVPPRVVRILRVRIVNGTGSFSSFELYFR